MTLKPSKLFILLATSILLLAPHRAAYSCAGGWDPDDVMLHLFSANHMVKQELKPFTFTWHHFGGWDQDYLNSYELNTQEWISYFKKVATEEEVSWVVYKTDLEDLRMWRAGELNTKNNLAVAFRAGQFAEALEYLIFAKEVEPHATYYQSWWDEGDARDYDAMARLIDRGVKAYSYAKDEYIKLRYAYQVVRLCNYSNKPEEGIKLYDKMVNPIGVQSIIRNWALEHKAGMLQQTGKEFVSLWLWGKLFNDNPERRLRVQQSFEMTDEDQWVKAMKRCNTDEERAALWTLLSIETRGHSLDAMRFIRDANPNSEYLQLLMVRELQLMEEFLGELAVGSDWRDEVIPEGLFDHHTQNYVDELTAFFQEMAQRDGVQDQQQWCFGSAYLYYLQHQYGSANMLLADAQRKTGSSELIQDHLRALNLLVSIEVLEDLTPGMEDHLASELEWLMRSHSHLPSDDIWHQATYRLATRYSDPLMTELCLGWEQFMSWDGENRFESQEGVAMMLGYFDNTDKTKLQQVLEARLSYNKADLLEVQATDLLREMKVEKAATVFNFIRGTKPKALGHYWELPADPFRVRLVECKDCDYNDPDQQGAYTKASFANEMVKLSQQIASESDAEKRAMQLYLLGNAFYNMSNYGNAYWAIEYSYPGVPGFGDGWSSSPAMEEIEPPYEEVSQVAKSDNHENYLPSLDLAEDQLDMATAYYYQAFQATNQPEFKARLAFMLAKCEQNRYFETVVDHDLAEKAAHRSWFKVLVDEYNETAFYDEAIEECKYFRYFASTK